MRFRNSLDAYATGYQNVQKDPMNQVTTNELVIHFRGELDGDQMGRPAFSEYAAYSVAISPIA